MSDCDGSFELFPGVFTLGECGSAKPHDGHDFTAAERVCAGAPAGVEADCGRAGPHGEHPLNVRPEVAR